MTDDNDLFTPAQYREYLEGQSVRSPHAHPWTGTVENERVSRYLSVLAEAWRDRDPHGDHADRLPGEARNLREVERIRAMEANRVGREARKHGDMSALKHLTGDTNEQADISGIKAIGEIDAILDGPAPVVVILGAMGTGKTELAALLAQRAREVADVEKLASNIRTLSATDEWTKADGTGGTDGFVPNHDVMMEWVKQDGDPLAYEQSNKLFVGDEFSSHAGGSGESGYKARKKMGPMVFKIRKYDGMLVYIGHDTASIHPLLARVGVVIEKHSKKRATVWDTIKNGSLRGKITEIERIPPSDYDFHTKEASSWAWSEDEDDESDEQPDPGTTAWQVAVWTVQNGLENDSSVREIADFVPYGKTWVSDRKSELEAGEHQDAVDRVEALCA